MQEIIERYLKESSQALLETLVEKDNIMKATDAIIQCYKRGNKLLVAGHGGSDADASHIVGELVAGFMTKEGPPLPAINLYEQRSALTAWLNDVPAGHETYLKRAVQSYGKQGDVFLAISTSGNAQSLVSAVEEANRLQVETIGLLGKGGGKLKGLCKYSIVVPHKSTPIIQTVHNAIYHAICEIVEKELSK